MLQLTDKYSNLIKNTTEGNKILEYLERDERVKDLIGKKNNGTFINEINMTTFAMWHLWCINEYGQQSANKFLENYLNSDEIDVYQVLWIIGILSNEPIVLKDGYSISSIEDIVNELSYDKVFKETSSNFCTTASIINSGIVKKHRIKKVLSSDEMPNGLNVEIYNREIEIAILLNSIEGISCLPYMTIPYIKLTTFPGIFHGVVCNHSFNDVIGYSNSMINENQVSMINMVLNAYDKLNPNKKDRINNVLNRLAKAKRQEHLEDKILDLGIALEMMLLDDNDDNTQLSLSFRLRGAWLLSRIGQNKKESYDILKDIYKFRSQVAHTGILCGGDNSKIGKLKDSFSKYQAITEDIWRV